MIYIFDTVSILYRGDGMIIDSKERFNTDEDELIWTKIIRINPFGRNDSESTHVVKYYKTKYDEEYYIFEYVMADNNSTIINNFNGYHWNEVVKQIKFSHRCYIYSQSVVDKNDFIVVTRGNSIYKHIQEDIE